MKFKIIVLFFCMIALHNYPMVASTILCKLNYKIKFERPSEDQIVDSTKNSSSNRIGVKEKLDAFFTAFGQLFVATEIHEKSQQKPYITKVSATGSLSDKKKEVFGFYPYELEDAVKTYDFNVLTSVAYFGCDLDPISGKFKSTRESRSSKLLVGAKANDKKVYLTVTCLFGEKYKAGFLDSTQYAKEVQKMSIGNINQLLINRDAYGVVIYFEDLACDLRDNFTKYIMQLSEALKKSNKKVVIALPAVDHNECYDVLKLQNSVAYFIVRAENYYPSWKNIAGPVVPAHGGNLWTQGNLEFTIVDYLHRGISKEKLIIYVPFYGNKWETTDNNVPTNAKFFLEKLPIKRILKNYAQKVYFDPESQSNYLNYKEGDKFIQVWFDDSRSLSQKYDLIKNAQLAGVAYDIEDDISKAQLEGFLNSKSKRSKESKQINEAATLTCSSILGREGVLKGLLWVSLFFFVLGILIYISFRKWKKTKY